jgi:hypothetical protein
MIKLILQIIFILIAGTTGLSQTKPNNCSLKLPVLTKDRCNIKSISLTKIGRFGEHRKERISVPAHLHTGIDIKRPTENYTDDPVFSVFPGKVISIRSDGPFAQIIIEHLVKNIKVWSVYEHVAGIVVKVSDNVDSYKPIARFMNKKELNTYGWQFDHCHLEILKVAPKKLKFDPLTPGRYFTTYNLECFTLEILNKYYYDPIVFLSNENSN